MKKGKSIIILVLVGAVLIFLSASFTSNTITTRGIVLGIGVDYVDEQYVVTCEIVSPGGGQDQQVGTFSKLIEARGVTVPDALSKMYADTGRKISLGQCQILLLGDSLYTTNQVREVLPYFVISDEYKDSSTLCCVVGSAKEMMLTQLPLSKSISFTLVQLLKEASLRVAIPNVTLSKFVQSSISLGGNSLCPLVRYVAQEELSTDKAQPSQGTYYCQEMVLFDSYRFVSIADYYNSIGYTLLAPKITGQVFSVTQDNANDMSATMQSVIVTSKNIDITAQSEGLQCDISVEVYVKALNNTDMENGGTLHPQVSTALSQSVIKQAKQQITVQLGSFLDMQRQYDVDIIGVYKAFEIAQGAKWEELSKTTKVEDIDITLSVKVAED